MLGITIKKINTFEDDSDLWCCMKALPARRHRSFDMCTRTRGHSGSHHCHGGPGGERVVTVLYPGDMRWTERIDT